MGIVVTVWGHQVGNYQGSLCFMYINLFESFTLVALMQSVIRPTVDNEKQFACDWTCVRPSISFSICYSATVSPANLHVQRFHEEKKLFSG